jgi:hypothetical protein
MSYQFARVDLDKTNYEPSVDWEYIISREPDVLAKLDAIYKTYCTYKHFASVMPMFHSRYLDPMADIIGYYDNKKLVAWRMNSMV